MFNFYVFLNIKLNNLWLFNTDFQIMYSNFAPVFKMFCRSFFLHGEIFPPFKVITKSHESVWALCCRAYLPAGTHGPASVWAFYLFHLQNIKSLINYTQPSGGIRWWPPQKMLLTAALWLPFQTLYSVHSFISLI